MEEYAQWNARTAAALVPANSRPTTCQTASTPSALLLAVLLLHLGRIAEVAAVLEPADFADKVNRSIYAAMLRLHSAGKPIDITLLVGELRDRGQYGAADGVSATTLVEPFRLLPLVWHLPLYLERVAEMSERRKSLAPEM